MKRLFRRVLASLAISTAFLPSLAGIPKVYDREMGDKNVGRAPMFENVDWTKCAPWAQSQTKPLIIWQWMDGLVTKEGITRDLEAFKAAGLAGVQNFQIGGPQQIRIGNPDNAIGNENWKELIRYSLDECERLGLTFGTHNCPGWSSSAYPTVTPKYSMQKLVFTETPLSNGKRKMILPIPEIDPQWNYYEDVAVMAVPSSPTAPGLLIIDGKKILNRN